MIRTRSACVIPGLLPVPVRAADAASTPDVLAVVLALAVVVAMILGLAAIARRGLVRNTERARIRLIGGLSLGGRERVVLIRVGGRDVLLGVSPGRVNMLCPVEGLDPDPLEEAPVAAGETRHPEATGPFARALAVALGRERSP